MELRPWRGTTVLTVVEFGFCAGHRKDLALLRR